MRILKALIVSLACLPGGLLAGVFEEANEAYESGRFAEAKNRYEALAKSGPWSANLFYNLGDTYFRLGDAGRAALQFERALALDPSHEEARANLTVTRQQSVAKIWNASWRDHVFPQMQADNYVLIASLTGWAAIGCFATLLVKRRSDALGILAFGLTLAASYAVAGVWHLERDRGLGIITAREYPARLAPADSAGLVETLTAGSRVRILSERGDWIYCALPGDRRGWLPATQLERVRLSGI